MFILVAGCGRLGAGLAKVLSSQGHDVVAICAEGENRGRLENGFDGLLVNGSPSDADVLREAGIEKADLLVAATANDNLNVMAIQIAKEIFKTPMVLARISDPEREKFYKGMGLSTVCPTTTGINQIINLIQKGFLSTLTAFMDPDLVGVKPLPEWIGKSLAEISPPLNRSIVGRLREGRLTDSVDTATVERGDTIILVRHHDG